MNAILLNKPAAQVKDNRDLQNSISSQLKQKLQAHYKSDLFRSRLKFIANADVEQKNKLNFASNNYLGLANNPVLINQVQQLLPQLGLGSGASNLITGYHHIHQDLEIEIAKRLNCEQALLFSSGYMANLSISDVLLNLNPNTIALHDHNNHASLLDGTRLAGCKLARFKHNDIEHLNLLLNKYNDYQNRFIFTESLFSMDGDFAPLIDIASLLTRDLSAPTLSSRPSLATLGAEPRSIMDSGSACFALDRNDRNLENTALVIDHSHGFGLFDIGPRKNSNAVIMGTFGKAIGASGAFVAGSKLFIESLIQFARPYIYTTSLSPISAAASLLALRLINRDSSYHEKLFTNIEYFCKELVKIGITPINNQSPIQPIIIGNSSDCIRAAEYLNKHGIIATAIRAPTVPKNKARLRITLSTSHSFENIDYLIKILNNLNLFV